MTLKKFIPKNIRKSIDRYEDSAWIANSKPAWENEQIAVYQDLFPVTPGHLLFVPKKNDMAHIQIAYSTAYEHGQKEIKEGRWHGFNIGQNVGLAAGQTVLWPHVHLIPRMEGDLEPGKVNGIRLSHPNGDHKVHY